MKAVILAGGYGTRFSEETILKPKPMIEVGPYPILWHIMKIYSHHGINDFIVCLGYKGYLIKEYFANLYLHNSDVTFNFTDNSVKVHQNTSDPWSVTLVDTGVDVGTGGRLKRVGRYLDGDDFCFTYGDGLTDASIADLVAYHRAGGKLATVTAVRPQARYGSLDVEANSRTVRGFVEKPKDEGGWVNGGFFVLSPKVLDYIEDDVTMWETTPIRRIAGEGQLQAFFHGGFWQGMDTLRDKQLLDKLWAEGNAPWKVWK